MGAERKRLTREPGAFTYVVGIWLGIYGRYISRVDIYLPYLVNMLLVWRWVLSD
ncbi:hypothetical protein F4781DRAFT_399185 [Annulohypoxylon bovei var. microspora]|nr:hypothetical protein F4781DRAFT_399185 [Annulohypoxylon bovei var. microspora]